jgi:hypothetical protein
MIYTKKDKMWLDAKGFPIPLTRVSKRERFQEQAAASILKNAEKLTKELRELKDTCIKACEEAYSLAMTENKVDEEKTAKGNFTFYTFDRSVRIERSISDRIDFDSAGIDAAKILFDQFLNGKLEGTDEMVRELVMHAFNSKKGKLDAKKVLSLLSFRSKIKADLFQQACACIEKAIINPDSAVYYRIAQRQEDNSYKYLELNFSSI